MIHLDPLELLLLAYSFEVGKIILWFYLTWLEPRISSTKMKATRTRAHYLSQVLEAALDMGFVIVIGYGLILLSQSQALF
jgi:hypothetical protein